MITTNPFAQLNAQAPDIFTPGLMQAFIILMILLVIGGTIFDVLHKKSAKYFFENTKKGQKNAKREVSSAERKGLMVKTLTSEVLTSSEFSNQKRRLSHLMTMYGFIIFVVTTAIMIFSQTNSVLVVLLWHLGALSLAAGGSWFWFGIRADVTAEGNPWYKVARADLFIISLLGTSVFALLWSITGAMFFFVIFILFSTVLFGGVLWSKFAHMFFKPAAAYQKRITKLDGSAENLPTITRDDPKQQKRHSMELLVDAPRNMGPGIKLESPNHF